MHEAYTSNSVTLDSGPTVAVGVHQACRRFAAILVVAIFYHQVPWVR
jgi:hypothetical protein